MSIRLAGILSLMLNVVLAAAWLNLRSTRSPANSALSPDRSRQTKSSSLQPRSSPPPEPRIPSPVRSDPVPPWRRIESEDFPTFIANLRRVGCPERTVRDIVADEIQRLFDARRSNLPRVDSFWWTADERYADERRREIASARLELEQRSVLKALLGVEGTWPQAASDKYEWAIYCWGTAIPNLESVENACWILDSAKFQRRYFMAEVGQPLKLSEIARLKEMREETLRQAEAAVGQQRAVELLQLASLRQLIPDGANSAGVGATGVTSEDLRRIALVLPRDLTAFNEIIGYSEVSKFERFIAGLPPEPSADERMEALTPLVTKALGPRRAAQLTRLFDEHWDDSVRFTQSHELPQRMAEALSDVKHIGFDESKRLRDSQDLEPADEDEQLKAISQSTVAAVQQLLPDKAFKEYLQQHGQWITNMAKGLKP